MRNIPRQSNQEGLSLPEVLIASFILIFIVLSSVRMTTNALSGMSRSKSRSLVDTSIAMHIEALRKQSFEFLCTQGCSSNELSKALRYDLEILKPLCKSTQKGLGLGKAFLDSLMLAKNPENFVVTSIPPVPVSVTYIPDFNRLNITYEADTNPKIVVSTTLVPHAQGWCP
jgi:hypothetical protein